MTAAAILAWATLGSQLINTLAVPVASVIRLFKDAGGNNGHSFAHAFPHVLDCKLAFRQRFAVLVERVAGNVQAKQLFFPRNRPMAGHNFFGKRRNFHLPV